MKKTVLAFSGISQHLKDKLNQAFQLLMIDPKVGNLKQQFEQLLPRAHGMIGAGRVLNQEILQHAQQLKVISSVSVGYDNYDVDYLNQRGIMLTNTPHVLTESTADLAFALLMSSARRVVELDQWTKQGHWKRTVQPAHYGADIYGKTLGIIGLGHIGAAMAKRARFGFNMNILHHSRHAKPELEHSLNATFCDLNELLKQSDFVSIHVALNDQTQHLIGKPQLARMKKTAILINVARGQVIDEQALIEALSNQQILAAGLDVFEQEPLQHSELFQLPNVITLPHVGSATLSTRRAMDDLAFDNLSKALAVEQPPYCVNPHVLSR